MSLPRERKRERERERERERNLLKFFFNFINGHDRELYLYMIYFLEFLKIKEISNLMKSLTNRQ